MAGSAGGFQLDPEEAFFAEADYGRRPGVADDDRVAARGRHVVEQPLRAERPHAFLVAGQRQHGLAAPGPAVGGE